MCVLGITIRPLQLARLNNRKKNWKIWQTCISSTLHKLVGLLDATSSAHSHHIKFIYSLLVHMCNNSSDVAGRWKYQFQQAAQWRLRWCSKWCHSCASDFLSTFVIYSTLLFQVCLFPLPPLTYFSSPIQKMIPWCLNPQTFTCMRLSHANIDFSLFFPCTWIFFLAFSFFSSRWSELAPMDSFSSSRFFQLLNFLLLPSMRSSHEDGKKFN